MPSFISKSEVQNIKKLFIIHLAVTLVLLGISWRIMSSSWWLNFLSSQLFIWISILSLSVTVWLFFLKKNIALLIGVIVFKWPILIYLFYKMTKWLELESLPFALGMLPIFLSSIIWAFLQKE